MKKRYIEIICELALKWCCKEYGSSKYNDKFPPSLKFDYSPNAWEAAGYYDERLIQIEIYPKQVFKLIKNTKKSYTLILGTIIHEYIHYLQDPSGYGKLDKKGKDMQETEAEQIIHRDLEKCRKYVYDEISKSKRSKQG